MALPLSALPDLEEARKALSKGSSKERAALTKELWTAGEEALPLVETFLKSDDPEIRSRAAFLHQRILLGLRPDSPKELLELAESALKADEVTREKTLTALLDEAGGFPVALRLLDRWSQDKKLSPTILQKLAKTTLFHERLEGSRLEAPLSLSGRALLVATLANEGLQEQRIAVKLALREPLAILTKAAPFHPNFEDDLLRNFARAALLSNQEDDAQKILAMRKNDEDRQRLDLVIGGQFDALLSSNKESEILQAVINDYAGHIPADIEALRASGYDDPRTFSKALCALDYPSEAIEVLHDTGNHRSALALLLEQKKPVEALSYLKKMDPQEGSDHALEARLFLTQQLIDSGSRTAAKQAFAPLFDDVPKRVGHRQRTVALAYQVHDLETALKLSRFIRPGFSTHEMVGDMGSLFPGRGIAMAFWTKHLWDKDPQISAREAIERALTFFQSPDSFEQATALLSKEELFEVKALQEMARWLHRPEMIPFIEKKARREDDGHLLLPAISDENLIQTARIRACDIALTISPTSPLLHSYRELFTGEKARLSHTLALDDAEAWGQIGKTRGQAERTAEGDFAFEKALAYSPHETSFQLLQRLGLKKARNDDRQDAVRLLQAAILIGITDERVRCPDLLPLVRALRSL